VTGCGIVVVWSWLERVADKAIDAKQAAARATAEERARREEELVAGRVRCLPSKPWSTAWPPETSWPGTTGADSAVIVLRHG
jgi:hypothetical protein